MRTGPLVTLLMTALVAGGFLVASPVLAAANVTSASGGTNISIDTTSAEGGSGTFKTLSGPSIAEAAPGDIAAGTHTITLPAGWEFKTASTVSVVRTAGNIEPEMQSAVLTANTLTFTITQASTDSSSLAFILSSIQVRPTGTTPSSGNMTYSGAGIAGVDGSTNFGTLSTVAGTVTQLAFTTQPGNAVYGSPLTSQPVVKTRDQFGNDSANGASGKTVTLGLNGSGTLQGGSTSLDISSGTATFSGLEVDWFGEGKTLTASATGLTSAVSSSFEITKKALTATVTVNDKPYDGSNSAAIIGVSLVGVEDGDAVTVNNLGTATFDNANAGNGKTVTVAGATITGDDAENYTYDGVAVGTANITQRPITITAGPQSKVYGDADPTLIYNITSGSLIGEDNLTGSLSRDTGENVGTHAITQGTVDNSNYAITFVSADLAISQRPITVTAVSATKIYDGTTTSATAPAITVGALAFDDTSGFSQTYDNETVGTGKTLTPSGIANDGNGGANYQVTFVADTTGVITQKSLTVSGLSATSKAYDGTAAAVVSGTPALVGVESGDDVSITGTAAGEFNTANAGASSVAVSGLSLAGADAGNYSLTQPTLSASITPKAVTVTPDASQTKIYGNNDPSFTYTATALVGEDAISGVLDRDEGENVGTYAFTLGTLSAGANYELSLGGAVTFAITQRDLTVTATGIDKEYDGDADATVTLSSNEISGDDLVLQYTSAAFADKTAATGKTVTVSGISIGGPKAVNYNLINTTEETTADITKKTITLTINVNNKTYNGTTDATYSSTDPRVLNGVVTGDVVVANNDGSKAFADKNVGIGKIVTATGVTLSGADKDNYTFNGTGTGTADITARPITVTAATDSRVYDGGVSSSATPIITTGLGSDPIVEGDTANFIQTYDNKNAVSGKTLTPSGSVSDGNGGANYAITFVTDVTGEITQKAITVTAQAGSKEYDGTTTSGVSPVVGNLEGGDSITTNPVQAYDNENVGTNKTLTPSGLVINDGNSGNNYNITYTPVTTGTITAKALTVSGAVITTKTYNGDANATVDFSNASVGEIVAGDTVSLDAASYTASFNDEHAATGKTVTVSGLALAGADAGNYTLIQPTLSGGTISPATLTITATGIDKVYDGSTEADVDLAGNVIGNDVVTFTYTASFTDKNVDTGKSVSVSNIVIAGGSDAGNYTVGNDTAVTTADITVASLTVTADDQTKEFGASDPSLTYTYSPLASGDTEGIFTGALERAIGETVGTYSIDQGDLLAGSNYSITYTPGTFTIEDTTAPDMPVITTVATDDYINNAEKAAVVVVGTAEVGSTVTVSLTSGVTVTGSGTADESGNYSVTINGTTLADGEVTVSVTATDSEDNVSTAATGTATKDIVTPTVTTGSLSPSKSAVGVTLDAPIVLTFSEVVTIGNVVLHNETTEAETTVTGGNISIDPETKTATITLPEGTLESNTTYTITVNTIADAAGNTIASYDSATPWQFTTATGYSIGLTTGWNLISLPVTPTTWTSLPDTLASVDGKVDRIWTYDAHLGEWRVYNTDPEVASDLTYLEAGRGYWIDMNQAGTLVGSGTLYEQLVPSGNTPSTQLPQVQLAEGWNMIGYYQLPGKTTAPIANALSKLSGSWSGDGSDIITFTAGTLEPLTPVLTMNPGTGYWLYMDNAKKYSFGNGNY